MGLVRLVVFILVMLVIWRMIKNYQAKKSVNKASPKALAKEKMVMCEYCSVHLPQAEALEESNKWFCNQQHKALYLQQH